MYVSCSLLLLFVSDKHIQNLDLNCFGKKKKNSFPLMSCMLLKRGNFVEVVYVSLSKGNQSEASGLFWNISVESNENFRRLTY